MPEHQQTQKSTESKTTSQKQVTPRIQTPVSNPFSIIQRAKINPKSLTHADVMQLQRTIGNRAVGRLFSEIGLIPSTAKQAPPIQRQELVQRQEIPEEEEPLQGKFESGSEKETCPSCMQRQEIPDEEEPLQGKLIEPIQRQEIPEEEEPLQGKFEGIQRQEIPEEEEPLQGKMIGTVQRQEIPEEEKLLQTKRENNTGMPDNLKAGVENLSGIDISDVKVHYNSSKPEGVGALAYTQGADIHVAPGQEQHLPHEAWHVVQQAQGRVRPTMQLKDVVLNDDAELEAEANVMGAHAFAIKDTTITKMVQNLTGGGKYLQRLQNKKINTRKPVPSLSGSKLIQRWYEYNEYEDKFVENMSNPVNYIPLKNKWFKFEEKYNSKNMIQDVLQNYTPELEEPSLPYENITVLGDIHNTNDLDDSDLIQNSCSLFVAADYLRKTIKTFRRECDQIPDLQNHWAKITGGENASDNVLNFYNKVGINYATESYSNLGEMFNTLKQEQDGPYHWGGAIAWEGHIIRAEAFGEDYLFWDPAGVISNYLVPTNKKIMLIEFIE